LRKFAEAGPGLLMNGPNSFSFKIKPIVQRREIREVQEFQGCSGVFWAKKWGKNSLRQTTGDISDILQW